MICHIEGSLWLLCEEHMGQCVTARIPWETLAIIQARDDSDLDGGSRKKRLGLTTEIF